MKLKAGKKAPKGEGLAIKTVTAAILKYKLGAIARLTASGSSGKRLNPVTGFTPATPRVLSPSIQPLAGRRALVMATKSKRSRFPDALFVRCPASLPEALDRAAEREMTTVSDYVRSAVLTQLRRDGIELIEGAERA